MSLTGGPLLALAIVMVLGMPALLLLIWSRVRGLPALRVVQRAGLVLACQLSAVFLAGLLVNDQFSLYDSWSDLLGSHDPNAAQMEQGPGQDGGAGAVPIGHSLTAQRPKYAPLVPRHGRVAQELITGPKSRIRAMVWVLFPPGYTDAAQATRRYPVIEFLSGYPGTPTTWLHALQLQQVMDAEVQSGKAAPFIAVLPVMNVATPRDTECTDIPKGPQVATWLGSDVPEVLSAQVRALPPGSGWGVTGYSTGGFCAAKMLLTHPESFGAAGALAAYYTAFSDSTTGDLFGGSQAVQDANDPTWLVSHRTPPARSLLVAYTLQDTSGYAKRFLAAVRPPLRVDQLKLPSGGHNTSVWLAMEPSLLDWLTHHLHADAGAPAGVGGLPSAGATPGTPTPTGSPTTPHPTATPHATTTPARTKAAAPRGH